MSIAIDTQVKQATQKVAEHESLIHELILKVHELSERLKKLEPKLGRPKKS